MFSGLSKRRKDTSGNRQSSRAAIQFFKIEEFKGLLSIRVLSSSGLCVVLIFLFYKVNDAGKLLMKFVHEIGMMPLSGLLRISHF